MSDWLLSSLFCGTAVGWVITDSMIAYRDLHGRSFGYFVNAGLCFAAGMALMYAWVCREAIGTPLVVAAISTSFGIFLGLTIEAYVNYRKEQDREPDTRG